MVPLSFAGQSFVIVDRLALYWPARQALIVADLHFEKASWYAARGQMLPPYDSAATLDRLEHAIWASGATSLWCLGDNFHDDGGAARLDPAVRTRLTTLASQVALHWITGNHDEGMTEGFGGTILPEARVDGLALRHRCESGDSGADGPALSGHFHPRLRIRLHGRGVRRSCFVRSSSQLILPAFGALTGGMDADDEAILAVVGRDAQAIVATESKALVFDLAKTTAATG
ncbi:ligase-associated DNA damage response endonuclease PdeM [Blastomonas sp.]|uniref:ligase-associated DNA damage response endonuclease PdeM n=1 Tax=Blastomonas sp. TaxID=1909299 RepID=UPI0035946CB9